MTLSKPIDPKDYNPITLSDYNYAVLAVGALKRQGHPEAAAKVEEAAKEIRRRLEDGK